MNKILLFIGIINCIFSSVSGKEIGNQLQNTIIWSVGGEKTVVFRKSFNISKTIDKAEVHVFADSYYALYINGNYVLSGPSRFDPKWPEYDTKDVRFYLNKGKNTIAVLVYSGVSNGMRMKHAPGFTMNIEGKDFSVITDASWKCNGNTRFKEAKSKWNGIDETIDASSEAGDCLAVEYDDSKWQTAVAVVGNHWGIFHPRSIPLLSENEIKSNTLSFPVKVDSTLNVKFDRNYLVTTEVEFEATGNATIEVGGTKYIAKIGHNTFRTFDSFGITDASLTIKTSLPITIQNIRFYNRIYPFELKGSFSCSDTNLNRLWAMSIHTLQQVTEDGYQDCPWERAEWMGDAGIIEYPLTRVAFVGDGNVLSDHRLIRKMLRDIAQSADNTGRIKAHHPSDRFDIHAYIEDYSCIWVQSLREYYDYSGDTAFVKEMWPVLKAQMGWFLKQRAVSGLVKAREFVIFDNPLKYKTCEGATLNAFVYKALKDGEYLGTILNDQPTVTLYNTSASDLKKAFNTVLWNDSLKLFKGSTTDILPTFHSALIPLDRGIVDSVKVPLVNKWLLDNSDNASNAFMTYTHFWFFAFLYAQDKEEWDNKIIDLIKARYVKFYTPGNKGVTVAENFDGNRPFHNFGTVPAYFMSTKILGITVNLPLSSKLILIKPHLGYLTNAEGTVVTEHGLVTVKWQKNNSGMKFELAIPKGKKALVYIPTLTTVDAKLIINNKPFDFKTEGKYAIVELAGGDYKGELSL